MRALADSESSRRCASGRRSPQPGRPPAKAETADHHGHAQRIVRSWRRCSDRGVMVCGTEVGRAGYRRACLGPYPRRGPPHRRGSSLDARGAVADPDRPSHRRQDPGFLGWAGSAAAVAKVGLAFDMKVIAWSQNRRRERCAQGVERVDKEALFRRSDILPVHLVLSPRSRGLVGPGGHRRR